MSNSEQHAGAQKNIPRGTESLFAKADFFIGSTLMSPMVAMLVSAGWWAIRDSRAFAREYKLPGAAFGEYLWLWAFAVAAVLFLVGVTVALMGWFLRRENRFEDSDLQKNDRVPRWLVIGNMFTALLLAPPLLTLLCVLAWTWTDVYRVVQRVPATLPVRYQDMRLIFGPAFGLGCMIALMTRISLVVYSLQRAKTSRTEFLEKVPPEKAPTLTKIGAAIGGLLVLPALAMVIVVCWDLLLGKIIGGHPRGGLSGMSMAMIRMITTLGPANFVGCTFLLWSGNAWLEHWCRNVRLRGLASRQKEIKPSLLLFAKIDGIVGALLMSPAVALIGVSAWMAFRRTFGRFPDRDLRRLLSADMISFLGPCIVAGSVVLLFSSMAWWFTHSAGLKTTNKDQDTQRVPRLVKFGAIAGAMLLSPVPAMILVMGWEILQQRFYPDTHLAKVESPAAYILEDASEMFGAAIAVGAMFVALSALGLCLSLLIQSVHGKPVPQMAQSFDDL